MITAALRTYDNLDPFASECRENFVVKGYLRSPVTLKLSCYLEELFSSEEEARAEFLKCLSPNSENKDFDVLGFGSWSVDRRGDEHVEWETRLEGPTDFANARKNVETV